MELILSGTSLLGALLVLSKKYQVTGFYLWLIASLLGFAMCLIFKFQYMAMACVGFAVLSVVNISRRY